MLFTKKMHFFQKKLQNLPIFPLKNKKRTSSVTDKVRFLGIVTEFLFFIRLVVS